MSSSTQEKSSSSSSSFDKQENEEERLLKRPRLITQIIGTHSGNFHCDEALACYMLTHLTKEFKGASVKRSRDPKVLETCSIVVDVGGIYDPKTHKYDHHQIGFTETFNEKYTTKLSSAGLVYKHFGKEIISNLISTQDEKVIELLFNKIYEDFVHSIDAIDNGVERYPVDIKPKYKVVTDLGSRVGSLNPWWNDSNPDYDGQFLKAMELAGSEFVNIVNFNGKAWLPARTIVERAINDRFNVDSSGSIIILDGSCPWKSHLLDIEEELNLGTSIIYAIFADTNGSWRVQAVPNSETSFTNRKPLPKQWQGKRDQELSEASGVPDCVFVHISGFIGGNKTKEGAIQMARLALQIPY